MTKSTIIGLTLLALLGAFSLTSLHSQTFSEPSGAFPSNNAPTPINISNQAQTKQGKLTLQNTLSLSNNRAINLKDPINPQDAVTKGYVDGISGLNQEARGAVVNTSRIMRGGCGITGCANTGVITSIAFGENKSRLAMAGGGLVKYVDKGFTEIFSKAIK